MTNKIFYIFSALIIIVSLFLRLYKIENRAPFDWDQNRDYQVILDIARGKPTLIGPVAKGEGGFFLGPLYYYLVSPVFLLMGESPVSLPITSAILDVLSLVLIMILLRKFLDDYALLMLAYIWSISWFAIEMAKVSWNVALLQLWIVGFIYLLQTRLSSIKAVILGLILGLTWHIHASLIPLSLVVFLLFFKHLGFTRKICLWIVVGYLFALSPLILFDLRHGGLERHLIYQFIVESDSVTYPFLEVLVSVFSRYGKNTIALLTGQSDLHLWWGLAGAVLSLTALFHKSFVLKVSGAIILTNIALTLYLGEPGFPEYYLAASYLPGLLILISYLFSFKRLVVPACVVIIALFTYLNISRYTWDSTSFSLIQKLSLAREIASLSKDIDIRYDLPFGRESGIPIMLSKEGVNISTSAKTQVVVTESTNESLFIDGELAKEIGYFGGLRVGFHVVQ